eukprot:COSAG02_NODE_56979_length_282_cov_1.579235_1_plen_32_part_01
MGLESGAATPAGGTMAASAASAAPRAQQPLPL